MFINKGENFSSEGLESKVLFYGGEFGYCFSNFAAFAVIWQGRTWMTSEHAYQAAVFDDESIIEEIFNATSAHNALKLAIKYVDKMRSSWQTEKYAVMKEICQAKLDQHSYIQETLKKSGDAELVEDSPKDAYWGRGAVWTGENNLGKVWMELREEITIKE